MWLLANMATVFSLWPGVVLCLGVFPHLPVTTALCITGSCGAYHSCESCEAAVCDSVLKIHCHWCSSGCHAPGAIGCTKRVTTCPLKQTCPPHSQVAFASDCDKIDAGTCNSLQAFSVIENLTCAWNIQDPNQQDDGMPNVCLCNAGYVCSGPDCGCKLRGLYAVQNGKQQCVPACVPNCGPNAECGPDGCGGVCGSCKNGQQCVDTSCIGTCKPTCVGRDCGDDGCGGSCGQCSSIRTCGEKGLCEPLPATRPPDSNAASRGTPVVRSTTGEGVDGDNTVVIVVTMCISALFVSLTPFMVRKGRQWQTRRRSRPSNSRAQDYTSLD